MEPPLSQSRQVLGHGNVMFMSSLQQEDEDVRASEQLFLPSQLFIQGILLVLYGNIVRIALAITAPRCFASTNVRGI